MEDYEEYRPRRCPNQENENSSEDSQRPDINYDMIEQITSTLLFNDMPTSVTERDLRHALDDERARYLDIRFVRDKSRCFAFVDFASPDEALRVVKTCRNQINVRNYRIAFDFADPKDESDRCDRPTSVTDSRFSGNVEEPTSTIMVRGMPVGVDERDIMDELNRAGVRFQDVRVIRDRATGVSRGFGFIEFASTPEATRWMDTQNGVLNIRRNTLRLNFSSSRNETNSREIRPNPPPQNTINMNQEAFNAGDWICSRCSSHNFRRRDSCFRCQLTRSQSQVSAPSTTTSDGSEFIGTTPCNTLILRCLDALTTEATIQTAFGAYAQVQMKRCLVMRDSVTNASRCFAFVELASVADAYRVVDTIVKEHKLFEIDGKAVAANYAKNNFNTIMAILKADGAWCETKPPSHHQMPPSTILPISSQPPAPTAIFQQPLSMNPHFAGAMPQFSTPPPPLPASSGAAVAAAAIQQKQTEARLASIVAQSVHHPRGVLSYPPTATAPVPQPPQSATASAPAMPFRAETAHATQYPFPDTTTFLYDETIRYYYDPMTGLYYEPNTRYFFDRTTQSYFHYDAHRAIYIPASQVAGGKSQQQTQQQDGSDAAEEPAVAAKKADKKEKEKNAQRIAKEMEKWAKRMNSQKETITSAPKIDNNSAEASKTADMAYAMLQAASTSAGATLPPTDDLSAAASTGLVAQYGGEDSEDEEAAQPDEKELEAQVAAEEEKLMDWSKNACLLCSRGFKDSETMKKHRAFSNLHIQNLNKLRAKYGLREVSTPSNNNQQQHQDRQRQPEMRQQSQQSHADTIASLMQIGAAVATIHAKSVAASKQHPAGSGEDASPTPGGRYRDRARERREKFGSAAPPTPHKRDAPLTRERPPTPPQSLAQLSPTNGGAIGTGEGGANVGSRLMAKMGWQAGQGLGRANQGRTQLVEAEFREVGVGLGVKNSKRLPPADNYKDNVKRAMFARYHELE